MSAWTPPGQNATVAAQPASRDIIYMKTITIDFTRNVLKMAVIVGIAVSLGGCGSMSRAQKHAAIGAGAGGAIGYVLTGGPVGTIVGAAAGGLIGAGH